MTTEEGKSTTKETPKCKQATQLQQFRQKRRRQPLDMEKLMGDFKEQQKQTWDKFMEWEEKRLSIEAEQEAKRRQEDRKHEMRLFSMLASAMQNFLSHSGLPDSQWQGAVDQIPTGQYPPYHQQ